MIRAVRLWLARLLVAVIAMGGGLNGHLAYAIHDDHVGAAHVLGTESGKHEHSGVHGSGDQAGSLFCPSEASCHDETGHAHSHVHVYSSNILAVTPDEMLLAHSAATAVIHVDVKPSAHPSQILCPPFKPPRASA